METDSFYVTDSGTAGETSHVRYTHPFYAELGGREAAGTDYIVYDHTQGEEPHYTAEIGFRFVRGDTLEFWTSGNGHHMNDDHRTWGYQEGVTDSTEMDFLVDRMANGVSLPSPERTTVFLRRSQGWIGGGFPTALAPKGVPGDARPRTGWAAWGNGSSLTVPDRATRLLLLDAKGRTAWKAEALAPGNRLDAPTGLKAGVFRCVWLP
jgi:hypothetical protein